MFKEVMMILLVFTSNGETQLINSYHPMQETYCEMIVSRYNKRNTGSDTLTCETITTTEYIGEV